MIVSFSVAICFDNKLIRQGYSFSRGDLIPHINIKKHPVVVVLDAKKRETLKRI